MHTNGQAAPGIRVFDDDVTEAVARYLALAPAAPMAELAAAAGVSRATIFRRYPSRDALVAHLCEATARAFIRVVADAEVNLGSPPDALTRAVTGLGGLAPVAGLLSLQTLNLHVEATLLNQIAISEATLRQLIRRGQDSGHFRTDIDPEWVLTMMTWLMTGSADALRLGRLTWTSIQHHLVTTINTTVLRRMVERPTCSRPV